ncbi:MAG TPA: SigE family RNA polymerase sigma factor [Ilumatobacteraceae bacterium]|nr:SigE family RNA polymerase sigma factor [Ilumatobacteraceae bacterium]
MTTSIQPVEPSESAAATVVWVDEGFAAFVQHGSAGLARTAFLLTADRHLAEDLLQATLAKVADRWSRIAATGDPTPYVRKVMLHTAISWRRRLWNGELPTETMPEMATPDHDGSAADERLRRAMAQIAPRQRAALVLRYYDDLSEAETAAALGCSLGTVKSQTAKGLARLRTLMAAEHDG